MTDRDPFALDRGDEPIDLTELHERQITDAALNRPAPPSAIGAETRRLLRAGVTVEYSIPTDDPFESMDVSELMEGGDDGDDRTA